MSKNKPIKPIVAERVAALRMMQNEPEKYGPIPTGIPDLDKHIGGWLPGKYVAIGGNAKSFKTTFALQAAQVIASANRGTVAYFPLEDRDTGVADRVITRCSAKISRSRIRDLQLTSEDFEEMDELVALYLEGVNLNITDEISTVFEAIKETKEKGYSFVFLDYFQLFTDDKARLNETQRLDLISRMIMQGRRETGAAFILVFQLNKENKGYGSSAVYRDADLIIHIEAHKSSMDEAVPGLIDIVVQPSRDARGGGRIPVIGDGDYSRILPFVTNAIDVNKSPEEMNTIMEANAYAE